jgi:hypothetical protein
MDRVRYGLTNSEGNYTFIGWAPRDLDLTVFKGGYYETPRTAVQENSASFRLRKVGRPVAMYAKEAKVVLPSDIGEFGYDLFRGDLVEPYGLGEVPDVVLRVHPAMIMDEGKIEPRLEGDLIFPEGDDGIQLVFVANPYWPVSTYSMPLSAPILNYCSSLSEAESDAVGFDRNSRRDGDPEKPIWHWSDSMKFYGERTHYRVCSFIRVRSTWGGGACYGLIVSRGSFYYSGGVPTFSFTYYLNPDHTRNIEFTQRLNLFKNRFSFSPGLP